MVRRIKPHAPQTVYNECKRIHNQQLSSCVLSSSPTIVASLSGQPTTSSSVSREAQPTVSRPFVLRPTYGLLALGHVSDWSRLTSGSVSFEHVITFNMDDVWASQGSPSELPQLHVDELLLPYRHQARARAYPQWQRPRPRDASAPPTRKR